MCERETLALKAEMKITHLQRAICKAAQYIYTFTFGCCKLLRVHRGISISSDKMSSLNASARLNYYSAAALSLSSHTQCNFPCDLDSFPNHSAAATTRTLNRNQKGQRSSLYDTRTHHFILDAAATVLSNVYEFRFFFIMTWICASWSGARYIEIFKHCMAWQYGQLNTY